MTCSSCGNDFWPPRRSTGRPRSRCEQCRSNLAKIDGVKWRKLRRRLLAGDPPCSAPGCPRPATEVDHVLALANGGDPYAIENLQPMCKTHNASKGARLGVVLRQTPNQTTLQW